MFSLFYQKNNNDHLFKECDEVVKIKNTQNYIPLYDKYFSLNTENFKNVNLNHKFHISQVLEKQKENLYSITIFDIQKDSPQPQKIDSFFKFSPLLDPAKYMYGKYKNYVINELPSKRDSSSNFLPKVKDENNSAFIDSFFNYLTSKLKHTHHFCHGIDFYGSFLGIKEDFVYNVVDDLDYLCDSEFFHKENGNLFTLKDADEYFSLETRNHKNRLQIKTLKEDTISIASLEDYGSVFTINESREIENENNPKEENFEVVFEFLKKQKSSKTNSKGSKNSKNKTASTSSSSSSSDSCSSNSSQSLGTDASDYGDSNEEQEKNSDTTGSESGSESGSYETESSYSESSEEDVEYVESIIKNFPVQMICLEKLENTLDDYIENNEIKDDEWKSILFQIIMTLVTYQKCFDFTHNDLHTNNVMYIKTDKKFINYCFNGKHYKVPTYGKVYKIIDFGRSIYKFQGKLCISDSFHPKGDAATQYNIEPYFNAKKPLLQPNKSFTLYRLACSLFDYFFEDIEHVKHNKNKIAQLINTWCLDDKERNILYKSNGEERYENFKLYKMIARTVHNHTPQVYVDHDLFSKFKTSKKNINKKSKIINIDNMPRYI